MMLGIITSAVLGKNTHTIIPQTQDKYRHFRYDISSTSQRWGFWAAFFRNLLEEELNADFYGFSP